ncbi:MAG: hypothetical protein KDK99_04520, partial [Verrucomicrobiales bacterium]|nr:hypothetical protein [Verrucomicrobiales bacterium]
MKWHQSFRTKLILTFFPMVAAVVIAAVWFSERRFSRLQQEVFNQQFQESIASFDESRTRRFEALSASLSELAALPAVRTALESGSQNDLRSLVLPRVQDLGGRQLESEGQSPARPAKGSNLTRGNLASTLQKLPLVALVDEKGSITASFGSIDSQPLPRGDISDAIRQAFRKHTRERSEQFLRLNGRTLEEVLTGQQVGYVLSHADNDQPDSVREVFVTPVRDAAGEKFLGALVLGLPLPAAAEQALYRQTRQSNDTPVMSGILIDGQLTSNTIPPSQRPLIANLVQDRIAEGALEGDALIVPLDGVRHRVIFRRLNPDSPFPHAIQVNLYSLARLDAEIAELRT